MAITIKHNNLTLSVTPANIRGLESLKREGYTSLKGDLWEGPAKWSRPQLPLDNKLACSQLGIRVIDRWQKDDPTLPPRVRKFFNNRVRAQSVVVGDPRRINSILYKASI